MVVGVFVTTSVVGSSITMFLSAFGFSGLVPAVCGYNGDNELVIGCQSPQGQRVD